MDILAHCERKKERYTDDSFPPKPKSLISDWNDESEDIQEIVQVKVFDPNFHEAVITTETDKFESDTIIKVIRKGYVMDDKVIRPAQVEIDKEPSQKEK